MENRIETYFKKLGVVGKLERNPVTSFVQFFDYDISGLKADIEEAMRVAMLRVDVGYFISMINPSVCNSKLMDIASVKEVFLDMNMSSIYSNESQMSQDEFVPQFVEFLEKYGEDILKEIEK